MKTLKLRKADVLKILIENRDKHMVEYNEAIVNYRKVVVNALRTRASKIERDGAAIKLDFPKLVPPIKNKEDYDRAILMLEMSVDETIELSDQEFECYVRDKWVWRAHALHSNSRYLGPQGPIGMGVVDGDDDDDNNA